MAANGVAYQVGKIAFGSLAELVIMGSLLADYASSRMVAGVKPFGGRRRLAVGTGETDAGAHLHERAALRKLRRLLVFHPHQSDALIILEHPHRTDRDFVPGFGLTHRSPVSRSTDKTHNQQRDKDGASEDEEGFFQTVFLPSGIVRHPGHSVNSCVSARIEAY